MKNPQFLKVDADFKKFCEKIKKQYKYKSNKELTKTLSFFSPELERMLKK